MFKNFLKGMVMGLANIIPGVSGGTLAVSMGIYDKLIHCLTHLFKEFKESIRFVLPIILGMIVALAGLSFVIISRCRRTDCLLDSSLADCRLCSGR